MQDFNIKNIYKTIGTDKDEIKGDYSCFYGSISDKPKIEQQLFYLQKKYLKTRDHKVWSEMLRHIEIYMESLLKARLKGSSFLSKEDVYDKAMQASIIFMSQYLNRKSFEVGASFAGMMKWKLLEILYNKKIDPFAISLDNILDVENNSTEFNLYKVVSDSDIHDIEKETENKYFKESFVKVLEYFDDMVYDNKLSLLSRILLLGMKNSHNKKMFEEKFITKFANSVYYRRSLLCLLDYLKNGKDL